MALSGDQLALLNLLLAGDSYEQVAEVHGTSAGEVRRRARKAAAALEGERNPELPPEQVRARLASLEGRSRHPTTGEPATEGAAPRLRQRWPLWAALGAAIVVTAVVVIVASSGGGGAGDRTTTGATPDREDVVPIKLRSVDGSSARGAIAVVRASGDQPAVDLAIGGLRPSGRDQTYVLWFVGSGGRSLPVAFRGVGSDGRLTGRAAIPTAAASLLPSFDTAVLTLAGQRQAAGVVRRAAQSGTLPEPVGRAVLRGDLR